MDNSSEESNLPSLLTSLIKTGNYSKDIVACDFFTVPTATFKVLFVFIILAHARRRIVHVNITEHPTAQWTLQQIVEAFPWDTAPRYLLRDRDSIYGTAFQHRVEHLSMEEVMIAPHSPWQNPYAERVIGSIRGECLNDVMVLNEQHLRRVLQSYVDYYHPTLTPTGTFSQMDDKELSCIVRRYRFASSIHGQHSSIHGLCTLS
jgi:transposase InsO family protein